MRRHRARIRKDALLTLIKTLFEIALLRKGPEALPPAWLVVYVTIALWLAGIVAMAAVVPNLSLAGALPDVAGWALSICLFALVISTAGFSNRLPQGLGALVGTGAVILFGQVLAAAFLLPLQGPGVAGLAMELLLLWSIFVKGRIISATINVHTLLGMAISIIVYVLRFFAAYALVSTS